MIYSIKKTMIALLLLAAVKAPAQKMITFESNTPTHRHSREPEGKNAITLGTLSWLNGYAPVYYERALLPFMSVQVGAGITFRSYLNDIGMIVWDDGMKSEFFSNSNDIPDDYTHYQYRKSLVGTYFSIAPKFYPTSSVLNGVYISPMMEIKNYKYKARIADVSVRPDPSSFQYISDDNQVPHANEYLQEHMNCLDLTVNFGGQYMTRSHVALGWGLGIGVRSMSSRRLDLGYGYDAIGNPYYTNNTRDYDKVKPLFTFNFVVGGWF